MAARKRQDPTLEDRVQAIEERGFVGTTTDPTPDENYTLAGVGAGKPTPETDEQAAAEARAARGVPEGTYG